MGSDNPSGADNQQERPDLEQWTVGFVDGEGRFTIIESVVPFFEVHPLRTAAAVSVSGILRGHTPAISSDNEMKIWS